MAKEEKKNDTDTKGKQDFSWLTLPTDDPEYQRRVHESFVQHQEQMIIDQHNQPKKPLLPVTGSTFERQIAELRNKTNVYNDSVNEIKYLFVMSHADDREKMRQEMLSILKDQDIDFYKLLECLKVVQYDLPGLLKDLSTKYATDSKKQNT